VPDREVVTTPVSQRLAARDRSATSPGAGFNVLNFLEAREQ
jgi:hypothetical protein